MKYLATLLFVGLAFFASAQEQEEEEALTGPKIVFAEKSFEFGDITQGEKVEHIFMFENIGTEPLILSDVRTTCGCTAPEWPREPIAPGAKAKLKVVFNSTGKMGLQNKVITDIDDEQNAKTPPIPRRAKRPLPNNNIKQTIETLASEQTKPQHQQLLTRLPWIPPTSLNIHLREDMTLGCGVFGFVCQGSYNAQPVATKIVWHRKWSNTDKRQQLTALFNSELNACATVNGSQYVVHFHGYTVSFDNRPILVMEYMAEGSLENRLTQNGKLPLCDQYTIAYDLGGALHFLRSTARLLHCDVKPANILLHGNGKHAKLTDFGLSVPLNQLQQHQDDKKLSRGTPYYAPPESFKGQLHPSIDIYSYGVVLYEMHTKAQLYALVADSNTLVSTVQSGKRPRIPSSAPKSLARLIRMCWHNTPEKRTNPAHIQNYLDYHKKDFNVSNPEPAVFVPDQYTDLPEHDDKQQALSPFKIDTQADFITPSELQFDIKSPIGEGAQAVVCRARHHNNDVAVKVVYRVLKGRLCDVSAHDITMFTRELNFMTQLDSPYITTAHGYSVFEHKRAMMVMEYLPLGDLYAWVNRSNATPIKPQHQYTILHDLANAIHYLHVTMRIFHGDIKSPNVLLHGEYHAKLTDFGFALTCDELDSHETIANGSPLWMAPEIFRGDKITLATDIYAFGIVAWETISQQKLYEGIEHALTLARHVCDGNRPSIPTDTPKGIAKLITSCWRDRPTNRPQSAQLVNELAAIESDFTVDNKKGCN